MLYHVSVNTYLELDYFTGLLKLWEDIVVEINEVLVCLSLIKLNEDNEGVW